MTIPVWKEILCVGRQQTVDGRWFDVTSRDIADGLKNGRKMLARGVPIPGVWEHQKIEANNADEFRSKWKEQYAKLTFCHLGDFRINARGNLEGRHDLRDEKDREQLAKTKFVSPKMYRAGYEDSRGGRYRGTVVAHVAATPTPLQFWQRPFEMSDGKPFYLSYGDSMAEEKETKDEPKEPKEGKSEPKEEPKGGESGEFAALIEALREAGLNIPDEVEDTLHLIIAIKASGGCKPEGDELDEGLNPEGGGVGDTTTGGSPPMLMSATDPKVKKWAARDRRDLDNRAVALFNSGRIDRPTARKLRSQARSVEMSYTKSGDEVETKLHKQITAYEQLPAHMAWSATGERKGEAEELSAIEIPGDIKNGESGDGGGGPGQDAVVKEQERLAAQWSVKKS